MNKTVFKSIICLAILLPCLPSTVAYATSNLNGSFSVPERIAPAAITLSITNQSYTSVTLSWNASGDDGNIGTAAEYDIRYSTSSIDTEAKWQAATQVINPPSPKTAGVAESFAVTGLLPCSIYYFAIKTADEVPNWSGLSNSPSATTLCLIERERPSDRERSTDSKQPPKQEEVGLIIEDRIADKTIEYKVGRETGTLETIGVVLGDGLITLHIPKGAMLMTQDDKLLTKIQVNFDENPPPPPGGTSSIVLAYNFGPDGATFNPPITLTFYYDISTIPGGFAEEDLSLAYFVKESGNWVELWSTIDVEGNAISARVSHFCTFAVFAKIPPPAQSPAPEPASFAISNLSVTPSEVKPTEQVTISAVVTNAGGSEGSYTFVLKINGVEEAKKEVVLGAGRSETVSFTIVRGTEGPYTVNVDGEVGQFTVIAPQLPITTPEEPLLAQPPINWGLIGGIIAGCFVATGLLTYFVVWRKRGARRPS